MQSAILIPKKNCLVRDPGTFEALPMEGQEKVLVGKDGRYWKRRLKDGSVTIKKTTKKIFEKPKIKAETKKVFANHEIKAETKKEIKAIKKIGGSNDSIQ